MNSKIKILLYSSNIWYLGEGMLGPLFAVFAQKIGGSILQIIWAWSVYMIVTGLLLITIGRLVEKKKIRIKEEMMVVGYGLSALFTFGYLFVSAPWHLFIVQAGLGVAVALSTPTWSALYAKYEDKKQDTYEWGLASGEARIIIGIAIVIGGWIVTLYSFKALFITMGTIQVIATIYLARILKKNRNKELVQSKR